MTLYRQPFRSGDKSFTSEQRAHGDKLAALVAQFGEDAVGLEAATDKLGYKCDSTGQWWHIVSKGTIDAATSELKGFKSEPIPTPEVLQPAPLGSAIQRL